MNEYEKLLTALALINLSLIVTGLIWDHDRKISSIRDTERSDYTPEKLLEELIEG